MAQPCLMPGDNPACLGVVVAIRLPPGDALAQASPRTVLRPLPAAHLPHVAVLALGNEQRLLAARTGNSRRGHGQADDDCENDGQGLHVSSVYIGTKPAATGTYLRCRSEWVKHC